MRPIACSAGAASAVELAARWRLAHIIDWPRCVELAGEQINGRTPSEGWLYGEAVRYFHDLGNVLPLCPNCHGLYDGIHYTDVTECEIRSYRDDAVRQPETLARLIDFVGVELSGRPNRCTHKVADRRKHSRTVNLAACTWPLIWIARGYELGVLTDSPHLIVRAGGAGHYHLRLDTTQIRLCSARGLASAEPTAESGGVRHSEALGVQHLEPSDP